MTKIVASGRGHPTTGQYEYTYGGYLDYEVEVNTSTSKVTVYVKAYQRIASGYFSWLWNTSVTYNGETVTKYADVSSTTNLTFEFTYSRSATSIVINVVAAHVDENATQAWWFLEDSNGNVSSEAVESITLQWDIINTPPTVSISTPSTIMTGNTAIVTWTASDEDNDTVKTTKLIRYLKKSGESDYTATTLISTQTTSKSYTDTIPVDAVDGLIYYVVTVTDGYAVASATSTTVTISEVAAISNKGSVNIDGKWKNLTGKGYANINGEWKSLTKAYVCVNGAWKSC